MKPLQIFTIYPKPKHIQIQPSLVKSPYTVEFAEKYVSDLIREYGECLRNNIGENEMNKSQMELHAEVLGCKARDRVTGFEGVITTLSFDLYGCVQYILSPPMNSSGEIPQGAWFDVNRVEVLNYVPVMKQPDFCKGYVAEGRKGASNKLLP